MRQTTHIEKDWNRLANVAVPHGLKETVQLLRHTMLTMVVKKEPLRCGDAAMPNHLLGVKL